MVEFRVAQPIVPRLQIEFHNSQEQYASVSPPSSLGEFAVFNRVLKLVGESQQTNLRCVLLSSSLSTSCLSSKVSTKMSLAY